VSKGAKIAIIVFVVFLILSAWKRKDIVAAVTGVIETSPVDLARADGVTIEIESLARTMESEESSTAARTAIGWATKNAAKKAGKSITDLVTKANDPKVNGKYSRQDVGGKWCATSKSPSRATLSLAADILAGKIPDPTKGATQWDAPKAQAALHAKNPAKFKSPEEVAQKRLAAGRKLVVIDGVPNTRFWA
jgi:hypothetical protein